jgi:mono/diheme cytochrome c family protein
MRRWLKWLGGLLGLLLLAGAGVFGVAWWHSETALARRYTLADPPLARPTDAAALAQGRHLFETRGCNDCHDADGRGKLVMDAGPVARVVAPNITPARLAARGYDADAVAAAIRHGVRPDGTPLVFMPSHDYAELGDADTAALVAYLATLPDADHEPGATEVRALGRVLHLFGGFPLLPAEQIDHAPRRREAPAVGDTVAYGHYVAQVCTGCHGADFGGAPPLASGAPPVANLTPAALGGWSEADFVRVLREGVRPDGRAMHPMMPWRAFSRMTDVELRAMWRYLRELPPVTEAR